LNVCCKSRTITAEPYAGLLLATNGEFYGTTDSGGLGGALFEVTAGGKLTILDNVSGSNLYEPLMQAGDGLLYGTARTGGTHRQGAIFSLSLTGTLTILHNCTIGDGAQPMAGLVQAPDGNLYGTTEYGGAYNLGTVFTMNPSGELLTLYSFTGGIDGSLPKSTLLRASDGNFYGTTNDGGTHGYGSIFKMNPSGTLTTLHSFSGPDGINPAGELIQATDGNLYGMTSGGGAGGLGTIFQLTLGGALTTIHSFAGTDGSRPLGGLFQATNGSLYGTTNAGGTYESGNVFELSMGFGPFVITLPTSGKTGSTVSILGTNLTGATSVTFNGAEAPFTVNSTGSAIATTAPAGATSGVVEVVTPSGTLSSNVPFRVVP
jgi:uncharacterized repeat protein (TIGR03803 family)